MRRSSINILIFVLITVGTFVYVGDIITRLSGETGAARTVAGVSPEGGESIFWGKGKCGTCHSMGTKGAVIRCPNLGESEKFPLSIGVRAEERAKEREKATGKAFSTTDYLVESIANPGAYVVEGYKNEMPLAYKPPISLKPDEVKAVITYLQNQGGMVDVGAIKLPDVIKEAKAEEATPWRPYMPGDPGVGKEIFFDVQGNAACAKCHKVGDKGGEVGPELTDVAGTRTPQFIIDSILKPSEEIASGFEPYLIITKDGRYLSGVKKGEDGSSISLGDSEGKIQKVAKADIKQIAPQKTSVMPGNLGEILTMDEFHSLLAFLVTLK